MINEFGYYMRDYRIANWILTYNMAKSIGTNSSFLSGCECSRHLIPESWKTKLPKLYPDMDKEKIIMLIDRVNESIERR